MGVPAGPAGTASEGGARPQRGRRTTRRRARMRCWRGGRHADERGGRAHGRAARAPAPRAAGVHGPTSTRRVPACQPCWPPAWEVHRPPSPSVLTACPHPPPSPPALALAGARRGARGDPRVVVRARHLGHARAGRHEAPSPSLPRHLSLVISPSSRPVPLRRTQHARTHDSLPPPAPAPPPPPRSAS